MYFYIASVSIFANVALYTKYVSLSRTALIVLTNIKCLLNKFYFT